MPHCDRCHKELCGPDHIVTTVQFPTGAVALPPDVALCRKCAHDMVTHYTYSGAPKEVCNLNGIRYQGKLCANITPVTCSQCYDVVFKCDTCTSFRTNFGILHMPNGVVICDKCAESIRATLQHPTMRLSDILGCTFAGDSCKLEQHSR